MASMVALAPAARVSRERIGRPVSASASARAVARERLEARVQGRPASAGRGGGATPNADDALAHQEPPEAVLTPPPSPPDEDPLRDPLFVDAPGVSPAPTLQPASPASVTQPGEIPEATENGGLDAPEKWGIDAEAESPAPSPAPTLRPVSPASVSQPGEVPEAAENGDLDAPEKRGADAEAKAKALDAELEALRQELGWQRTRELLAWSFNWFVMLLTCVLLIGYARKLEVAALNAVCVSWLTACGATLAVVEPLHVLIIACAYMCK